MAENIQVLNKNDLCFENIGYCCFVVHVLIFSVVEHQCL